MPAVVPAIGSFFSAVGTFAASSAVAGFLVNTVSSIALSALATAIAGKPKVRQSGISTDTTTAGGTIPQRLIFGRYATAGQMVAPPMVYQTDGNPNEWLVYVISLADKPVTGLGRIIVDGKILEIDGNPAASAHGDAMGATVLETDQGNLRDKVYIRFHDGNQTAADAYLRRVFGDYPERPWTADMIGYGVAYAVVTFKGKAQDGDYQGFPSIKFEVDGHKLRDPRTGTEVFTRNPAVIAWNILRGIDIPGGERWGVGATSFVDSYVIAAANLCDSVIPTPAGGTRTRYQAGLEISVADEPHEALMEVVKAMGGDVADMGGTWLLTAGEPGAAVLSITDDDIIVTDSRSLKPYPGLDETYNAIHASYPEPAQQWEAKEAVPLYNATYEAKDGGRRLIAEVDFPAVTDARQVRALMGEMLADHRRMRTHVITLPPDALGLKLGDHLAWSSEVNFYSTKLFKVTAMRVDPLSLCVAITITERDPSDYDDDAARDGVVPTVPSPAPVAPIISGVTGWSVTAVNAGGRPGIRMAWDADVRADAIAWNIRRVADGAVVNRGSTADIRSGSVVITAGLLPDNDYEVTGRLILRRETAWTQVVIVRTLPLGLTWDDLTGEVRDSVEELEEWAAGTDQIIREVSEDVGHRLRAAFDEVGVVRDGITEIEWESYAQRQQIRTTITAEVEAARGQFEQRIDVAARDTEAVAARTDVLSAELGQTKAAVTQESLARAREAEALAGQITTVRASLRNKAEATAVQALTTRVEETEEGLTATSTALQQVEVTLGEKASAAAVQTLAGRVTETEDGLEAQSDAITQVQAELTGKASASALAGLTTRVEETEEGLSSTSSALQQVEASLGGKADASAVQALTGRVQENEQGLASQSDAITQVTARTNRGTASGLLRIGSESSPAGVQTRIGLRAEATANDASHSAALFLEAKSDGTSQVGVAANRFFVATTNGPAGAWTAPFIIDNGVVYIDIAMIKDGTIDNAKIGNIIQSLGFVSGPSGQGWRINKDGSAEFNDVVIRRQIEVASGSLTLGNFVPRTQYAGRNVDASAQHFSGADVDLENGPGLVQTVLATPIPITAWQGQRETYIATAGMTGTVTSPDIANCYWGWTADVLPLTKWNGNQTLRLRLSFWSQEVSAVLDCAVTWKIYRVS